MLNSSIQPIDRTLSGATTQCQGGSVGNSNEGELPIPKTPALLNPHHQIPECNIQDCH